MKAKVEHRYLEQSRTFLRDMRPYYEHILFVSSQAVTHRERN